MRLFGLGGPRQASARVAFAVVATKADARLDAGFGGDGEALPGGIGDAWKRLAGQARRLRLMGGSDLGRQQLLSLELGGANWYGPALSAEQRAAMERPAASYGVFAEGAPADISVLANARQLVWRVAELTQGVVLDRATLAARPRPEGGWVAELSQSVADDVLGQIQFGVTTSGPASIWTMGLCKYGQPELCRSLPNAALQPAACSFMGAVAQAVVRAGRPVEAKMVVPVDGWSEVRFELLAGRRGAEPRYEVLLAGDSDGSYTFAALAAAVPSGEQPPSA